MCGRYAIFTEEENAELREIINSINERYKDETAKENLAYDQLSQMQEPSCTNTSKVQSKGNSAYTQLSLFPEEPVSNNIYQVPSPMKTGEIFPTNIVPVITGVSGSKKIADLFKWGFPNYRQNSGVIINARSETLSEKPTFRKLLKNNRCLVPASGFYEWKTIENRKEKYLIRSVPDKLMYFAGLYNSFIDKNGIPFTSFVIITTEANSQMSQIHTRMPVILSSAKAMSWINGITPESANNSYISTNTFDTDILSLLKPYDKFISIEKLAI
ncbi:SOS response-associated peptidase [Ruminiclostridium herbifermentans]|uniref:Abasic site processing protein n=1 Tax=Ruminiclostridium herbifermentans TaxID=2488810 RepID=A0A4U7JM80_9FIRM|nr:SOS response-associated peptidase [Ruminiclostridium herbifermentans]QNU65457.1 SOS response-associated peptidase [Ruminiclostridium herbifermentans]